jgi:hypothetical protein
MSLLLAWFLIGQFLWNVLVPAHEYQVRSTQIMTMIFDFGMVIGLLGYRRVLSPPLFWCALIAGIGLFALRLTKDGYWTGHLVFTILPRN